MHSACANGLPLPIPPSQASSFPFPLGMVQGSSTAPRLQIPRAQRRRKGAALRKQPHRPVETGHNSNRERAHPQPTTPAAIFPTPDSSLPAAISPPFPLRAQTAPFWVQSVNALSLRRRTCCARPQQPRPPGKAMKKYAQGWAKIPDTSQETPTYQGWVPS